MEERPECALHAVRHAMEPAGAAEALTEILPELPVVELDAADSDLPPVVGWELPGLGFPWEFHGIVREP